MFSFLYNHILPSQLHILCSVRLGHSTTDDDSLLLRDPGLSLKLFLLSTKCTGEYIDPMPTFPPRAIITSSALHVPVKLILSMEGCVVLSGFFNGSCANCVWGGEPSRCSLRKSIQTCLISSLTDHVFYSDNRIAVHREVPSRTPSLYTMHPLNHRHLPVLRYPPITRPPASCPICTMTYPIRLTPYKTS